jgi:hypothetical protein
VRTPEFDGVGDEPLALLIVSNVDLIRDGEMALAGEFGCSTPSRVPVPVGHDDRGAGSR